MLAFGVPRLGASDWHRWNVAGSHLAERVGLFVMIALGESLLLTGLTFTGLEWTPAVAAAMAAALIQAIAMWWIYFGQHADAASHTIAAARYPGLLARQAYTYVPILLIAGIIVSSVGDELTLLHPEGPTEMATALTLIGGPALFLLGLALFRVAIFGHWSVVLFAGVVTMLALLVVAHLLSPLLLSVATTAILVIATGWELLAAHRRAKPGPRKD